MTTARIATWNLERKKPTNPTGKAGLEHLASLDADVLVLTESRTTCPAGDGHVVWCRELNHGPEERRVVMWSRNPWTNVDELGHPDLPRGRFVSATTETSIGPVDVIGVCIPWHMANVQYGDRNRKPWEDHITYLEIFTEMLASWPTDRPVVVAGDFNQRLTDPMKRGGRYTEPMFRCFEQMDMPTIGVVPGWPREENDHIATRGLAITHVQGWPSVVNGTRCSDHGGVLIDVASREPERQQIAWEGNPATSTHQTPLIVALDELWALGVVVERCDPSELPRELTTHDSKHVVLLKPKLDAQWLNEPADWDLLRKGLTVERNLEFAYNAFWNGNRLYDRGLARTYVVDQSTTPWPVWSVDGSNLDVAVVNARLQDV